MTIFRNFDQTHPHNDHFPKLRYRKQEIACGVFLQELEGFIETIFHKGDIVILTVDFNVWGETDNTNNNKRPPNRTSL